MHKDNIVIRFSEGAASVNFDYVMAGHIVGVGGYNMEPYSIIFNYDFAKALWGEHRLYYRDIFPNDEWNASELLDKCAWHYHLQQMVIAEDPIKYLGENI